MKNFFLKKKIILSIVLVFLGMMGMGQNLPPNDTIKFNVSELSSPDAIFPVVQQRAHAYFALHPEMDSLNPLEKMAFKRWEDFWRNRASINDTIECKLSNVLYAMNDTNEMLFKKPVPSFNNNWKQISPNEFETQNMGTVTAIWVDPSNNNYILIGTESSGLWKTTNGGQNWINITDSYAMVNENYITAAGFGVSSIAVNHLNQNEIYIATFLPGTELEFGYGANILKTENGGATWNILSSYNQYISNSSIPNGTYYKNMVWKIAYNYSINNSQTNSIIFATIGKRLVAFDGSNGSVNYKIVFELGVNSCNPANPAVLNINLPNYYPVSRKIRDFEFSGLENGKLCLTTDGIGLNNNTSKAQSEVYHINYDCSNIFTTSSFLWNRIDLPVTNNGLIDNAAVECYNGEFYIAYDEKVISTTPPAYFNIARINSNLSITNIYSKTHFDYFYYPEHYSSVNQQLFNGFGYRYDAFKIMNKPSGERYEVLFLVGGFNITKILFDDITASTPNITESTLNYYSQSNSNNNSQNENFNKNKYCHNGIRTFSKDIFDNKLLLGNEGGISILNILNDEFSNINGKNLVITQFVNLASTKHNFRDVILGGSSRNGLWHYEKGKNNDKWRQFYWEDGGNSIINDQNPDNIFNIQYWWASSAPGIASLIANGSIYKTANGLSYAIDPLMLYPSLVCPSLLPQQEIVEGSTYFPPVEFHPSNNQILYLGKNNIWESVNGGNSFTSISNFPSGGALFYTNVIKTFKISQSNASIIYAAFADPTWGSGTPTGKLFKGEKNSSTGLWSWTDLTSNVLIYVPLDYTFRFVGATDIAINPTNPNEVYVSLNQFRRKSSSASEGRERVIRTLDGGSTWTEYSTGLTPAPVNCIKYYSYGGKNLLFVGTDIGVFYRDPNNSASTWTFFNSTTNPLPRCIVTDIEFYYPDNKIRVSTYGRGLWEAEIPCIADNISQFTEIRNGENIVWADVKYKADVVVKSGGTLTISGTVHFQQNTTLTVEPGGKLIIDGGTLTDICNKMWNGVVVQGYWNEPQSNTIKHGIIELINNGTISNAIIGVELIDPYMTGGPAYGAGIIKAKNSNFINNQKAVVMYRYDYINIPVSRPVENISYFRYCNFTTDNAYHDATNYQFSRFIEFNQIRGTKVQACSFTNSCSPGNINFGIGEGIYSNSSKFTVEGYCNTVIPQGYTCPSQNVDRSSFTNLQTGINAVSSNPAMNVSIKNTIFDNNMWGAIVMGSNNVWITENTFNIPDKSLYVMGFPIITYGWGLYLDGCKSGYNVEGNTFNNTNTANLGYMGMVVNNSESPMKTVYNNTFTNLKYGFLAEKNNGGNAPNSSYGLKIKCNDFINCTNRDIAVTPENALGISKAQGANIVGLISSPAGNIFSHLGPQPTDFDNKANNTPIYYHHPGSTNDLWVPKYYNNITPTPASNVSTFTKALACPPIALQSGGSVSVTPGSLSDAITAAQIQLNSARLILQIWVDGGNTEGLKQTVKLAYPWEAYTLFNELMAASPYLSDEVMIEAIQNEEGLPALMLKLVLLANPQAVRSERVMETLFNRHNPFPDSWIEELYQGLEVVSPKSQLEANVGYYTQLRQMNYDMLKAFYLSDTSQTAYTSLLSLLSNTDRVENAYELLFAYLAADNYEAAESVLESIPYNYNLLENDDERHYSQAQYFYSVYENVKENNYMAEQINPLYLNWIISESEHEGDNYFAANIRALRMQIDTSYHYLNPVWLPSNVEFKSSKPGHKNITATENTISISPNPANEYFIINYAIEEEIKQATAEIYDVLGKKINTINITSKIDQQLIKCPDYINGQYYIVLKNNNKILKTFKFNVIH